MTRSAHPAYGQVRAVTPVASVVTEHNPGPLTLEGTNTWLLRAPGSADRVVVDPGHHDPPHLERVADTGAIAAIVLTHHHADHAEGAEWLAERTGAAVLAFDPRLCRDADPLADGARIDAAGLSIEVWHTPGHTADSVCLSIEHGGWRAVLTGDSVLGHGTTVLTDLGDYLVTLRRLAGLGPETVALPGHGPELADLAGTAREYLAHRQDRLDQVRAALRQLGVDAAEATDATARQIVELVYADVDPSLWGPAEWSVRAQLDHLRATAHHG